MNTASRPTNQAKSVPELIAKRLSSPACVPLTPAEELAAATAIATQRADLWTMLASVATIDDLSLSCVAFFCDNDSDDAALIALAACAVDLGCDDIRRAALVLKRSKDRFIERNLRLVVSRARLIGARDGYSLPMDELIQEGTIGLMLGVCRFDPSRGFRFSTMATWWIDHHIGRAISDKSRTIRLPVHALESRSKIAKAVASLAKDGVAAPTDEMISCECAKRTLVALAAKRKQPAPTPAQMDKALATAHKNGWALSPKRIAAVREMMGVTTVSASAPVRSNVGSGHDDGPNRGELIDFCGPHSADVDATVHETERVSIVAAALSAMPADLRMVLMRRFGLGDDEPRTLADIGAGSDLGAPVSREWVRKMQLDALTYARITLRRRGISAEDVAWA